MKEMILITPEQLEAFAKAGQILKVKLTGKHFDFMNNRVRILVETPDGKANFQVVINESSLAKLPAAGSEIEVLYNGTYTSDKGNKYVQADVLFDNH